MRIKAFNEIMEELKGAHPTRSEVEKLAQQLHAQGIASTIMDAREKATSMIATEQHVTEEYTEKKEQLTTYNDPRNNPKYNKYRAAMAEEMRQRALNGPKKIEVQNEFQTPGFERKNGNTGLARAVVTEKPKEQAEKQELNPKPTKETTPEPTHKSQETTKKKNDFIDLADVFNYGK